MLVGVGVFVGARTRVLVDVAVGNCHAPKSISIVSFSSNWMLAVGWVVGV